MRSLVAVALVLAFATTAAAQADTASTQRPAVVAAGEGVVKRTPDRAWLTIAGESRARNPRDAQKQNADLMAAVLKKLRSAGLQDEALKTRGYDLQPEFDYNNGRQTLRGYVARNSLEVRVDDIGRVGEILDAAVASGATSVGQVRFDLKDRAAAEREALRLAVEDARRRAEAAAAGAGLTIDRIMRIEEHRAQQLPPRPMVAFRAGAVESQAAEPPIETGELDVRASVTIVATVR